MTDVMLLLIFVIKLLAVLLVAAVIADHVIGPWLEKRKWNNR